jgi:glutamyl-tRNA synthetase
MKISHVVRAEEHLSNTPRQIFIVDGLGYPRPEYAHLPYVAAPGSKEKLSKRKIPQYLKNAEFKKVYEHGQAIATAIGLTTSADTFNPVIVDFYEQVGYLPDAIINYLLLLGWSLDDKTESFTRAEMVKLFSLERVNKAPASFDPKKLLAFQERYMQALPLDERVERTLPFLQKAGLIADCSAPVRERVRRIVELAGERIKVAGDILDYAAFFLPDERLTYDEAAFDKRIRKPAEAVPLLQKFKDRLAAAQAFDAPALEKLLNDFAGAEGIKNDQIIHALRVAVTGKAIGFGLFDTLALVGKERCVTRIERAVGRAG